MKAGIAPDVVTFNTLINAAAKKGKLLEAVDWFHMAQAMSVRVAPRRKKDRGIASLCCI